MKFSKLFWGLLIILFGVMILGINLGLWDHNVWRALFDLWPLLFVLIGINLIFGENNPIAFILLVLAIIFSGFYVTNYRNVRTKIMPNSTSNTSTNENVKKQDFSSSKPSNVTSAKYEINIGAADINIGAAAADKLYEGFFRSFTTLSVKTNISNDAATITFNDRGNNMHSFNSGDLDRVLNLNLNPEVSSEINMNSGASNMIMNLSDLKIKKLSLDTGASKQEITFGSKEDKIEANISAGASKIKISVPKDYALNLTSDSALSDSNFDSLGLVKNGKNYKSEGFDSASKQATINISAGVSSIDIERY